MKHLAAALVAILILASCEGPTGPQGDPGPVGPPGQTGAQGPPGAANVRSRIISYQPQQLTYDANFAAIAFEFPEITQAVYDGGSVFAYHELSDDEEAVGWLAMPWTLSATLDVLEINYVYQPGAFVLLFQKNWEDLNSSDIPGGRVKVVIIPPGVGKTSSRAHKAEYHREILERHGLE